MGKHDRRRHQLGSFVAREAEHQTLVARALLGGILSFGIAGVDALRNIGRLAGDDVANEDPVGVENIIIVHVADLAHGIAHDLDIIEFGFRSDLAADDDDVALGVGLASDAAMGILHQARVEHRIGNGVANFVGVTFPDGFGRKNETTRHG